MVSICLYALLLLLLYARPAQQIGRRQRFFFLSDGTSIAPVHEPSTNYT